MNHTGSHDLLLVLASYGVAVLAAYTAIYCSTRIYALDLMFDKKGRRLWLGTGALYLGTGVWSMHFLGMIAHEMPMNMQMSFDAALTALSWLPAVLASALALHVITRPNVKAIGIVFCSIIMGAGIFFMHYTGMFAMKMSPSVLYDTTWVVLSGVIAVLVSGAAMVICRGLRSVPDKYEGWLKFLAALIMGGAISGMHYSGMAAVSYPAEAVMNPDNLLSGNLLTIPIIVVVCSCLLGIYFVYSDIKERRESQIIEKHATELAQESAFHDTLTGLNNRNMFEQQLFHLLSVENKSQHAAPFSIIYIELAKGGDAPMLAMAKKLEQVFGSEDLARYGTHCFMVILTSTKREHITEKLKVVKSKFQQSDLNQRWGWGVSCFPKSASNSRGLIVAARRIREWYTPKAAVQLAPDNIEYPRRIA